jgi:hypothetical protein
MKAVKWVVLLLLMVFSELSCDSRRNHLRVQIAWKLQARPSLWSDSGFCFWGGIHDYPLPWLGQLPFTQNSPFRSAAE